jgi:hypothetical protein
MGSSLPSEAVPTQPWTMRFPLVLALLAPLSCACEPHRATPSPPEATAPIPASPSPDSSLPDALPIASSSSSSPAPPYDLPADLVLRATAARDLFSRSAFPAYATRLEGSVYLLISPQGPAMLSAGADELRRALRFYYDGHSTPSDPSSPPPFTRHPDHAISVYLFATRAAFVDFSVHHESVDPDHPVKLLGFFAPSSHDLVISGQEGLGTLEHETIHTIVPAADFPGVPRWMNEGLASLFEQPQVVADGTMHGQSNARYAVLQRALSGDAGAMPARPSLVGLFAMSNHEFVGGSPLTSEGTLDEAAKTAAELLHYGMARSFCHWLDSNHHRKLWYLYHAWRDGFASDRTGEKAFAAVMGGSPAALEADWEAWVMAQRW